MGPGEGPRSHQTCFRYKKPKSENPAWKGQEDAASKTSRKAITTIDQAALFFTRNWKMMKNLTLHNALTLTLTPNPAAHAGKRQLQEEDMRTRGGLENLRVRGLRNHAPRRVENTVNLIHVS